MKKILITALVITGAFYHAKAQTWDWAKKSGGTQSDIGWAIDKDNSSNYYVTGEFRGTATFGTTNLTSAGSSDIFLSKYNSAGTHLWSIRAGGSGIDAGMAVATNGTSVYIGGWFKSTATFTGTNAATATVTASGSTWDYFLAKYNAAGQLQWVTSDGGANDDQILGIALSSNAVYVTGHDDNMIGGFTNQNFFLRKYNFNGVVQWTNTSTALDYPSTFSFGKGIDCDDNGNPYVLFSFQDKVSVNGNIFQSQGGDFDPDLMVSKFDPATGQIQWYKQIAGIDLAYPGGLSVAYSPVLNAYSIYVTGYFYQTATFAGNFIGNPLTSGGLNDVFVAKYTSAGNIQWAVKNGGGSGYETSVGISTDNGGNSFITGSTLFSSATFGCSSVASGGTDKLYVAKFNDQGNAQYAIQPTGPGYGHGVVNIGSNRAVVTGETLTTSTFGATTLVSSGIADICIAKIIGNGADAGPDVVFTTCGGAKQIVGTPAAAGCTYSWSPAASVTNPLIAQPGLSIPPNTSTVLTLTVNCGGCITTDVAVVTLFQCRPSGNSTSIQLSEKAAAIKIYPNPASDILVVDAGSLKAKLILTIFDMNGKQVRMINSRLKRNEINISNLPAGTYVLKMTDPSTNESFESKISVVR